MREKLVLKHKIHYLKFSKLNTVAAAWSETRRDFADRDFFVSFFHRLEKMKGKPVKTSDSSLQ